jgi:hypothetical protein
VNTRKSTRSRMPMAQVSTPSNPPMRTSSATGAGVGEGRRFVVEVGVEGVLESGDDHVITGHRDLVARTVRQHGAVGVADLVPRKNVAELEHHPVVTLVTGGPYRGQQGGLGVGGGN